MKTPLFLVFDQHVYYPFVIYCNQLKNYFFGVLPE